MTQPKTRRIASEAYADTARNAAKWFKGDFPETDAHAVVPSGLYWVPNGATVTNWPTEMSGVGGFLEIYGDGDVKTLTVMGYGLRPYTFRKYRTFQGGDPFTPWERLATLTDVNAAKWFKGNFPGTNAFAWSTPGLYWVQDGSKVANWPAEMSGVGGLLEVESNAVVTSLTVTGYGLRPYTFRTRTSNVNGPTFHPWERGATTADIATAVDAVRPIGLNHAVLLDEFTMRRGGTIGTDKAVVALRFDDPINGLINSGTAAKLSALGIPASAAHCSGSFTAAGLIPLSNLGTWQTVTDWAHKQGMEVHHHGGNHLDASGPVALKRETTDSLALLKASLPTLEVNKWMQPGVTGTNYDGFSATDTAALFYQHPAGRLILSEHAISSGYMPGTLRQLDGNPRNGLSHYTVDTPAFLTAAYGLVDDAIALNAGLCIMLHPDNLDKATFSTSVNFLAFLDHLAALRDEGKIEILTVSGLLCADSESSKRGQVIRNGGFASGLTGWLSTTGWTVAGGVASTSGTTMMGQSHAIAHHGWFRGGTMQLVAEVQAPAGAMVKLHQSSNDAPAGWTAEKTISVPASMDWVTVRLNACVPLNMGKNDYAWTRIGRVSGGALNVRNVRYQPV